MLFRLSDVFGQSRPYFQHRPAVTVTGARMSEAQISKRSLKIYLDFSVFTFSRFRKFFFFRLWLLLYYFPITLIPILMPCSSRVGRKMCLCVFIVPRLVDGEHFYYFQAGDGYLWARIKRELGTSDFDFILFYWHHDSLNLFIILSCARHVVSFVVQQSHSHTSTLSHDAKRLTKYVITESVLLSCDNYFISNILLRNHNTNKRN